MTELTVIKNCVFVMFDVNLSEFSLSIGDRVSIKVCMYQKDGDVWYDITTPDGVSMPFTLNELRNFIDEKDLMLAMLTL